LYITHSLHRLDGVLVVTVISEVSCSSVRMKVVERDGTGGCEGRCNDSRDADLGLEAFPEAIKSSVGDLQSFALDNLDIEKLVSNADFLEFLSDDLG
jgi:hypothetical protein